MRYPAVVCAAGAAHGGPGDRRRPARL